MWLASNLLLERAQLAARRTNLSIKCLKTLLTLRRIKNPQISHLIRWMSSQRASIILSQSIRSSSCSIRRMIQISSCLWNDSSRSRLMGWSRKFAWRSLAIRMLVRVHWLAFSPKVSLTLVKVSRAKKSSKRVRKKRGSNWRLRLARRRWDSKSWALMRIWTSSCLSTSKINMNSQLSLQSTPTRWFAC